MSEQHSRTFTWQSPINTLDLAREKSGLELMQMVLEGQIPPAPLGRALNFWLSQVEAGRIVFESDPAEYHYNPLGVVHGGYASTLLDSALGCVVHTTLPAGKGYTTVQINVNMTRAITIETGRVRCEARALHTGRRLATAEADLRDSSGKLLAHGTTTCMVFDLP